MHKNMCVYRDWTVISREIAKFRMAGGVSVLVVGIGKNVLQIREKRKSVCRLAL